MRRTLLSLLFIVFNLTLTFGQGNVGIGTTSPDEKLEVEGNLKVNQKVRITPLGSAPSGSKGDLYVDDFTNTIYFHDGTQWVSLLGSGGGPPDTDWIESNGNVIRGNGNVGIGIATPQEKLHILGAIRGNQTNGALRIKTSTGYVDVGSQAPNIMNFYTDNWYYLFDKSLYTSSGIFASNSADLSLNTGSLVRLHISQTSGFVGIGFTTPDEVLDVAGNIRVRQHLRVDPLSTSPVGRKGDVYVDDNDNTIYFHDGTQWRDLVNSGADTDWVESAGNVYRATGNVGVGVPVPLEKLHVAGAIRGNRTGGAVRINTDNGWVDIGAQNLSDANFNTDRSNYLFDKRISTQSGEFSSDGSDLLLMTNGAQRFHIDQFTGNAGIGTIDAIERLEVNGYVTADRYRFRTKPNNSAPLGVPGQLGDLMVLEWDSSLYYYDGLQWLNLLQVLGGDNDWAISGPDIVRMGGNVGIGDPSPNATLDVNGTFSLNGVMTLMPTFTIPPSPVMGDIYMNQADSTIYFYNGYQWIDMAASVSGDSDWAEIGNDVARFVGNVGIGTGSPQEMLDVTGNIRSRSLFILDPLPFVPWGQEGYIYVNDSDSSLYFHDGSQWINLTASSADDDWIILGNDIYRSTGNVGVGMGSAATELLEVNGNLKVNNKLRITPLPFMPGGFLGDIHVNVFDSTIYYHNGTQWVSLLGGGAGGGPDTDWVDNGTEVYRAAGNVGIGTSGPDSKLDVHGKTTISRDGLAECCGNDASLAIAENTFGSGSTGNRASISFYNNLETEGRIQMNFLDAVSGLGTIIPRFQLLNGSGSGIALDLNGSNIYYGNQNSRTQTRDQAGLLGNAGAQSGFFETLNPVNSTEWYTGAVGPQHLIDVRYSDPNLNFALQIAGSFIDQDLYYRKTNNDPNQPWRKFMTMETYSDHCVTESTSGSFDYSLALNVSEGICFLSKVNGNFGGYGESVSVEPIGNVWNIRINTSNPSVEVCARCIIY